MSGRTDPSRVDPSRTDEWTDVTDNRNLAANREQTAFLDVRNLSVHFPTDDGLVKAVDGVSFALARGRTLGIVGESGSGKSVTSLGILGLHGGRGGARVGGKVYLDGQELISAPPDEVRRLRGNKMAMIFQDPLSSMHPFYKIGHQIVEAYRVHNDVSKKAARARAIDMLDRVGIPQPDKRIDDYPHQFSGGMRQRAMIAMALVCNPDLLIADEPTTALDVTVQAQILDLIRDLQNEFGSAVIMITHDLGVPSSPTTSSSCTAARRSNTARPARCSGRPSIPMRGACSARCPASTGRFASASCRSREHRRA